MTTVTAALAIAHDLQDHTGVTIQSILHALVPLRSSRIRFGEQVVEFPPEASPQHRNYSTPSELNSQLSTTPVSKVKSEGGRELREEIMGERYWPLQPPF